MYHAHSSSHERAFAIFSQVRLAKFQYFSVSYINSLKILVHSLLYSKHSNYYVSNAPLDFKLVFLNVQGLKVKK